MSGGALFDLIEGWRQSEFDVPPYLFRDDKPFFPKILEKKASIYHSLNEYVKNDNFGNSYDKSLHLGLLPQPYFGDLKRASVFILMLNPGLSAGDYYAEETNLEFKAEVIKNLCQEKRDEYPFIFLNPKFAWHPGFEYFHKRFSSLAQDIKDKTGQSYIDTLRLLAKSVACLELMPYHSKSFGNYSILKELPSTKAMLAFVRDELYKRAKRDEVTIIVTRSVKIWDLPNDNKNIVLYEGSISRSAYLTSESKKKIMERLLL